MRIRKKSIFSKILISIISVSFVLGISVFFVAMKEQSQNLEKALVKESKLFAHSIAKDIEAGYLVDILPTQVLIEANLFEEALFLWIVQTNGEIYFADNPEMLGRIIKDPVLGTTEIVVKDSIFPKTGEKVKLIIHPLNMKIGDKPWSLFIGVSLESIVAARRRLFFVGSGWFALALFLFVLISFYLAKRVTDPLKKLEKGVRIIGKGNLNHQIKLKTGDEIEDLGIAFNQMAKDIKKHYISLEQEKNKTLAIINNFTDGILVLDKNNNFLLINPRAESLLGLKKKDLIGKSILELSKTILLKPLVKLFNKETKKEIFRQEFKIGEDLILEMSTVSIMKEKEKLGSLVILHNITEEKLVERMKNEFVSLAAHQLRTPLSSIKWTLKMFLNKELGKITKEQEEFLKDSYDSNERMISLVKDLLNVTRIEEGKYLYNFSLVDVRDVTQFVISSYKEEIKKKKIKIELKKQVKKLPKVWIDAEKMKMAIKNLVDNSIRYSHFGDKVIISLRHIEKTIKFSIKDNGIGIPKKQQKRVFTKFFRGNNITKIAVDGTGLGLFITKNIIEAHGGRIWFDSKEEVGTTFYFTIPIKKVY